MGLVRQESFPTWEVSPIISLLSWEGSGILGAGAGQPLGTDAKCVSPTHYRRLSRGSYDSELQVDLVVFRHSWIQVLKPSHRLLSATVPWPSSSTLPSVATSFFTVCISASLGVRLQTGTFLGIRKVTVGTLVS